ncbi:hypothetical protein [Actinocatenispora sera]|uniref:LPXTG-motif cell wall-anchored protein n=1 Tax=Actinocatenispora sera TaxID=390989 RepID=A0A810L3U5_9ACTN|nr:hypothetical protein [Actinocatenispora sera]BCJ29302.1 hypothetical protein Asera_34100 [Actinocatenispora sera]
MKLRTFAVTALVGGALALTAAAPALADATSDPGPSASPAPNGTIAVSASFDTKVAYAGDTVTLTVTSRQSSTANPAGSFALYWTGPISFTGHGSDGTCKANASYVYCPETTDQLVVTDTFTFAVYGPLRHNVVTRMQVKASSGAQSARTTAALNTCIDVSASPSPSESAPDSPSPSPSDEPTSPSASVSASASPSGSASESPSTEPSVTLAAGGSGGLPVTGTSLGLIGGAAAVLLAAGTVLTLAARRRRTRP